MQALGVHCPLSRFGRLFLTLLLVAATFALTATPASAGCSGVSYPRVRYWCDVISANTAKVASEAYIDYNEIYEGNGADLAVYFKDSGGTNLYTTYGTSYVYKSILPGTLRAACWNRESTSITARCDYVNA